MADYEVLVVGSGFAGLCMGIKLLESGRRNFLILEKDEVFGGTWRVNNYPGAACDVPSDLYSFSFAQTAEWTRKFPRQAELLTYTEGLVQRFGLAPYLRLGTALLSADYDEAQGCWRVRTSRGEFTARSLVSAMGSLSTPMLPPIPGLDKFQGKMFHSATWAHEYDLTAKRVAVIGTGASAIQFVPEIAPRVAQLNLYQRTAPWVLPRPDRAITAPERWLRHHIHPLRNLYRAVTYLRHESRFLAFSKLPLLQHVIESICKRHLRRQIPHNAALRAQLTPDYRAGCKRILLSSNYFPALARSNVALFSGGVAEIRANSVVGTDGQERPVDAIIFGTGFDVAHSMMGAPVRGRGGILLDQALAENHGAYKGVAVPGFPNFFMVTGPNTSLGHNSIIYMIESSVRYIMQGLQAIRDGGLLGLEVKQEVCRNYNRQLQQRLGSTVWSTGCKSWYLDSNGRNIALWPGFAFEFRNITRRFDIDCYERLTLAGAVEGAPTTA